MIIVQNQFEKSNLTIYSNRLCVYDKLEDVDGENCPLSNIKMPAGLSESQKKKMETDFGWKLNGDDLVLAKVIRISQAIPGNKLSYNTLYYTNKEHGWVSGKEFRKLLEEKKE